MAAYYNEMDRYAAGWLRRLIADGLIPAGRVDDRSIADVEPEDVAGFDQVHFFAGIGGWAHAARLAGWPDDRPLWTGSCPCQPFSVAGRRGGTDDARHLWPHFFRLIRAARPVVVMGEQVAGKAGYGWLDGIAADLASEGYACRAADIPACAVDAPHIRSRLWWCAVVDTASIGRGEGVAQPILWRGGDAASLADEQGGLADAGGGLLRDGGPGADARPAGGDGGGAGQQRLRADAGAGNGAGRGPVADTDGCGSGGRAAPAGCEARGGGGADERDDGDLAEPAGARLALGQRDAGDRAAGGGGEGAAAAGADGGGGALADANGGRRHGLHERDEAGHLAPVAGGDAARHGGGRAGAGTAEGRNGTFWSDAEWIACHDGKARRAEPGAPLLVDGLPSRVALWRGFGNAIVPQVAAEVIAAFMEAGPG